MKFQISALLIGTWSSYCGKGWPVPKKQSASLHRCSPFCWLYVSWWSYRFRTGGVKRRQEQVVSFTSVPFTFGNKSTSASFTCGTKWWWEEKSAHHFSYTRKQLRRPASVSASACRFTQCNWLKWHIAVLKNCCKLQSLCIVIGHAPMFLHEN